MMNRKMVKIICIIMAVLMLLSVGAIALQVFVSAADETTLSETTVVVPDTGDGLSDYILPAGIIVAAILAVVLCLVIPKIKKKNSTEAAK